MSAELTRKSHLNEIAVLAMLISLQGTGVNKAFLNDFLKPKENHLQQIIRALTTADIVTIASFFGDIAPKAENAIPTFKAREVLNEVKNASGETKRLTEKSINRILIFKDNI